MQDADGDENRDDASKGPPADAATHDAHADGDDASEGPPADAGTRDSATRNPDADDAAMRDADDDDVSEGPVVDAATPDADGDDVTEGSLSGIPSSDRSLPGYENNTPLPEVCSREGWCWTHPLPTGEMLVQVWAAAKDDLWVVGDAGGVLRWNGREWSGLQAPMSTLAAIWGTGPQDVWLGGKEGLCHWDGQAFTPFPLPSDPGSRAIYAIWGCDPRDVWAVGNLIWHWDGQTWSPNLDLDLRSSSKRAVWGTACNDVYLGQYRNGFPSMDAVYHWAGEGWSLVAPYGGTSLVGTGPHDIWATSPSKASRWTA